MNLSGFKKVHDDDHRAVLKNKQGHEITIAKKSLTSRHKKELAELPLHAFSANDGEPIPADTPPTEDTSLENTLNQQKEFKNQALSTEKAPEAQPPEESIAPKKAPALAAPGAPASTGVGGIPLQSAMNPAPAEGGGSDTSMPADAEDAKRQYIEDHANEIGKQAAQWAQDLSNGHVNEKTYSDLFAKKDTLGKIGSLFGLLVAGAGSGITGQPNVVIKMMDNEIARDLEAQKTSKANAVNYLRQNQEHELSNAQIREANKRSGLYGAQTEGASAEAELKKAQLNAWTMANIQPRIAAAQYLQNQVNKMAATNPQKALGQQLVDGIKAEAAAHAGQMAMQSAQTAANDPEGEFADRQKKLMSMEMLGMPGGAAVARDERDKHVPGFGDSSISVDGETRKELIAKQEYEVAARNYVDFAKKHQANWKNLNPIERQKIANQGAVLGAGLQGKYRNKTHGGVYKEGEQNFIESIIPTKAASWAASFNQIPKVEQTIKDNQAEKEALAHGNGLVAPRYSPADNKYYTKTRDGKTVEVK